MPYVIPMKLDERSKYDEFLIDFLANQLWQYTDQRQSNIANSHAAIEYNDERKDIKEKIGRDLNNLLNLSLRGS